MTEPTVEEIMTTPVLTVEPETPLPEIADAMLSATIKSIVVIDDGCVPDGILTSTDFIEIVADNSIDGTVGEYMTRGVETITPDASVSAAATKMLEHDISHLPVVDGDSVSGIVTATDVTGFVGSDHERSN